MRRLPFFVTALLFSLAWVGAIGEDLSACRFPQLADETPVALALPAPKALLALPSHGSNETVEEKAEWIASQSDLVATFSEIGAAQGVSAMILQYPPRFRYQLVSSYDMAASDARYGKFNDNFNPEDYISVARLNQQLQHEHTALRAAPGMRDFVLADTIQTHRANGMGWIGFQGRLADGEVVRITLHVRLFAPSARAQKQDIAKLGVNLIYAAFHYVDSPFKFYRSLLTGIAPGAIAVDAAFPFGKPSRRLRERPTGLALLEAGLTEAVVYDSHGRLTVMGMHQRGPNARVEAVPPMYIGSNPQVSLLEAVSYDERMKEWDFDRKQWNAEKARLGQGGRWLLVTRDGSPEATDRFLSGLVREPRVATVKKSPDALIDRRADPVGWKAARINIMGVLKGTIAEVGGAAPIASRIFAAPYAGTIYETIAFSQSSDSNVRYGDVGRDPATGSYATVARVAHQLREELARVQKYRYGLKFAVADTFEVRDGVRRGWIGVASEFSQGGEIQEILLEVEMPEQDWASSQETIGKLGVNLLYGILFQYRHPDELARGLWDGIASGSMRILDIQAGGHRVQSLADELPTEAPAASEG